MKSERVGKLDTARDIRKELARLYRAGRAGKVAASDCSKLASVLGLVLKSLEVHDLTQRVEKLEGNQS